jgi:hypothetical protein
VSEPEPVPCGAYDEDGDGFDLCVFSRALAARIVEQREPEPVALEQAPRYPDRPVIDVWAVLEDPDIPRDVGQRLLARQRARRMGVDPEPVPEGDKPYLARHIVEADAGE